MNLTREPLRSGSDFTPLSRELKAWTALQVALGGAVVSVVAATTAVNPAIALPWPGLLPTQALYAGIVFWLLLGLIGSMRARLLPGGVVLTFSMPFVIAGTIVGGPLVGVLMSLISEFELREIKDVPWYGILSNRAVTIVSAVGAAFVGTPVRNGLEHLLVGQEPLAFFLTVMVMALVFDLVTIALVIPTLALRHDLTLVETFRAQEIFRGTALVEGFLAWFLAAGYMSFGLWAAIPSLAFVFVVWQAHDRGEALRHDELTGLANETALQRRLKSVLTSERGEDDGSALVVFDLDRFKDVNDVYLHAAGDEVLATVARHTLDAVRATDLVARRHRAGDEFAIVFDGGVPDVATARRLAKRVQRRVSAPIPLRSAPAVVSVTCSMGVVFIAPGESMSAQELLQLAEARMYAAKLQGSGIVAGGRDGPIALARRKVAGPRRPAPAPTPRRRPDVDQDESHSRRRADRH